MELHFQYEERNVINALRFHFMNRPEIKLFKTILIVTIVFVFVGYFTNFITLKTLVWIFLLLIVLILFFWYILPFSVYKRAKTFKEPEITLRCTEDTLTIVTKQGESRIPWSRFSSVVETQACFYLYRTNKSFFLIPAYTFADRDERVAFGEMLQSLITDYSFK